MTGSVGRVYIQQISPSAKKFFERSASRGLAPVSLVASIVMLVIGTGYTRYAASVSSSSGLPT